MTKLNLGSGRRTMTGFYNVDIQDWDGNTNIKMDLSKYPLDFEDNSIEEIISEEFLEHLPFSCAQENGRCSKNSLMPGGRITLQVPDAGKAMEYYIKGEICDCVPHKAVTFEANPNCLKCQGKAKINPIRWLYTFTGAQKHQWDAHLNIFTRDIMEKHFRKAGFSNFGFIFNQYKLIIKAVK